MLYFFFNPLACQWDRPHSLLDWWLPCSHHSKMSSSPHHIGSKAEVVCNSSFSFTPPLTPFTYLTVFDSGCSVIRIKAEKEVCVICFSHPITSLFYFLPCNHCFCSCVHEWILSSNTCPLCRQYIDSSVGDEIFSWDNFIKNLNGLW